MFGFEPEEAQKLGSYGRFHKRIEKFKNRPFPYAQHYFWWIFHNCVAHMLIGVCPVSWTFKLHDWTSKKLNAE